MTKSCSFLVPYDAQPKSSNCILLKDTCPSGSICTAGLRVDAVEADTGYVQTANVQMLVAGANNAYAGTTCESEDTPSIVQKCPKTGTASLIGSGQSITIICENLAAAFISSPNVRGPDDKRRISCKATYSVRPAASLATTTSGSTVTIFAPGAGTLSITPGGGTSSKLAMSLTRAADPPLQVGEPDHIGDRARLLQAQALQDGEEEAEEDGQTEVSDHDHVHPRRRE